MDLLGALESYVCAVKSGSLSGAARLRAMTQPAISQQISALEAHLGAKFLHRGRAGVQMTPAGEVLFHHATEVLSRMQALRDALETLSGKVEGRLVVTAGIGISQHVLGPVITLLARRHPGLQVVLRPDDQYLDLVSEGIDLAIRAGRAGSGTGFVRRIGTLNMLFVATPGYLSGRKRPRGPKDLSDLDYIAYQTERAQRATLIGAEGQNTQVPLRVGLTAQLPDLVFQALHADLGFAKVPEFLVGDALAAGRLEQILPGWRLPQVDLFLAYPMREALSPRARAFLAAFFEIAGAIPGVDIIGSARDIAPGLSAGEHLDS